MACGVRPNISVGSVSGIALPAHIVQYSTATPMTPSATRFMRRRTSWPITSATAIAAQAGNTAPGVLTKALAMTTPNTALTISSTRNTTIMYSARLRLPITLSDRAPIDLPLWRLLAHSAPKSCTPAKKMVPNTTHSSAGAQPQ